MTGEGTGLGDAASVDEVRFKPSRAFSLGSRAAAGAGAGEAVAVTKFEEERFKPPSPFSKGSRPAGAAAETSGETTATFGLAAVASRAVTGPSSAASGAKADVMVSVEERFKPPSPLSKGSTPAAGADAGETISNSTIGAIASCVGPERNKALVKDCSVYGVAWLYLLLASCTTLPMQRSDSNISRKREGVIIKEMN